MDRVTKLKAHTTRQESHIYISAKNLEESHEEVVLPSTLRLGLLGKWTKDSPPRNNQAHQTKIFTPG